MKLNLGNNKLVEFNTDHNNCLGCHRIDCNHLGDYFCEYVCEITKRGLDGKFYHIAKIEDLIVKEEN